MAHDLIRLSGVEPGVDSEIEYTGVRPREKLFEELVCDDETISPTSHDKVTALNGRLVEPLAVGRAVRRLEQLLSDQPAGGARSDGDPGIRPAVGDDGRAELVTVLYDAVGGRPVDGGSSWEGAKEAAAVDGGSSWEGAKEVAAGDGSSSWEGAKEAAAVDGGSSWEGAKEAAAGHGSSSWEGAKGAAPGAEAETRDSSGGPAMSHVAVVGELIGEKYRELRYGRTIPSC